MWRALLRGDGEVHSAVLQLDVRQTGGPAASAIDDVATNERRAPAGPQRPDPKPDAALPIFPNCGR